MTARRTSINDVAKAAGVAIKTVSRVFIARLYDVAPGAANRDRMR